MDHDSRISGLVIGCAIEVHKALGPGLKESAYQRALCQSLAFSRIRYTTEGTFPIVFQGVTMGHYRPDLIVEDTVVVEVKSVDRLLPLFTTQLTTYLRITGLHVGLLLNFNCSRMTQGIKRVVL